MNNDNNKMNDKIQVNIGLNERCVRIIASIFFAAFAFTHNQWWVVPALLSLVTGIVGWSPAYQMLKINTNKNSGNKIESPNVKIVPNKVFKKKIKKGK